MSSTLTAGDVVRAHEVEALARVSGLRAALLVAHAWTVIAAAMALFAWWPSSATFIVAVVVIGGRQLGLFVLMHEAAHWRLFRAARANDRVARWLCAYPIAADDLRAYRRAHHQHHRHTRQPADPELEEVLPFPVTPRRFWRDALADLSGLTVASQILAWPTSERAAWHDVRGPIVAHAVILAALAAAGHPMLYPLLWLLPRVTWYPFATRLRRIAEHGMVPDDADPLRHARTTRAGWVARALVAPYWTNYHLEHHLLVFVPCWKLPRAHALLLARGHGDRMEVAAGYRDVVRCATQRPAGLTEAS